MSSDIRTSSLTRPVDIAEYFFTRLHQVGIQAVHGVPGDYNLVALDYVKKAGLYWVGNCNELNAGYAADGYARVKGIAAVVTTFGVGELSAINAIAGAFSEYVPIVHLVGVPSTISQADGQLLHHTLGNANFHVFMDMARSVSCFTGSLNDPMNAAELIDHAIRECWVQSRPVYLALPTDMVQKKVEGERLNTPIDLEFPPNDTEKEDYVVDVVLKYLHFAQNPVIIVDACAIRHRALDETHALVQKSGLPTFVAPMGKGAVNETLPNYGGVYAGDGSNRGVREVVERSDLVLSIGSIKSDFNTAGFTYRISDMHTIEFHSHLVRVRYSEYPGVRMNGVLRKIVERMDVDRLAKGTHPGPRNVIPHAEQNPSATTITHAWFWPRMGQWLQAKDVVITETGTANFGIWETRFPADVTALGQVLWGSIGYATAAAQGAALAAKEVGLKRTILFTGDGSFQLTAQEVSTMIRHGLNPFIFVICNDGYTIERYIHGMDESYNDVQPWKYRDLVAAFGAESGKYKTYQVRTKDEVEKLFADSDFSSAPCLQFIEMYMPKEDAPYVLQMTAEAPA